MSIDLDKFCAGEDELRYYLQKPFLHDGELMATNGHLIVSIPYDGRPAPGPYNATFAKSVSKIIAAEAPAYVRLSDVSLPPVELCGPCEGTGLDEEDECPACDGAKIALHQPVLIGATTFARRYLALIAELPDVEIGTSVDEKQSPVPFRFTGGRGCLMPIRTR